ncbi:hypothetical protein B0F90DRAFT_1676259 [Multifurca ochricompacta]|uniref:F-box domain-containing protein n=1 Tax=Multifurca ochricompacta TaxID=376703 RepID=A0AAD4MC85_9AGAM|nr:hypothetical protein B0F90DRAFT_1676259 [Multifurca ochricompacta]
MSPWPSSIPVELTLQILDLLDPQTLINCSTINRLFKSLIDETTTLQYRIALFASGMVDGPPGHLSASQRLSLLRDYEASWKDIIWNEHKSIPVPDGNLWELYGNVWARSRGEDAIVFVQLPSRLRGIPMRQWTLKFNFALRDFGMDPSQDLLVTIESLTNVPELCRIQLHKLKTGEKHPLARNTGILEYTRLVSDITRTHWSFSIRISGDYVGILFIDHVEGGNELVVWNWKTGARSLEVGSIGILSFVFLGECFVLGSALTSRRLESERPVLLLYSLNQEPWPTCNMNHAGAHLLRFLCETLPPDQGNLGILLTSDPSPRWSPDPGLQVPFRTVGDERIIGLNLQWGVAQNETFLISANDLLSHVDDISMGGGRDIEWESWGPGCIEHVPSHGRWTVWTCFMFGMRYILPRVALLNGREVIIIHDLCMRRCMRASEEEREESNTLHHAMGWKGPYPRSIVKCVPLPPGIRDPLRVNLMISEDGIVVLESDFVPGDQLVHLLTI